MKRETFYKHPLYWTWRGIIDRCERTTHESFPDYGGRGIKICTRWRVSFWDFISDMGPRPDGFTIERVDNDGDYEPFNCVWVSRKAQSQNKRNNVYLTHNGQTLLISEWAEKLGLRYGIFHSRLKRKTLAEIIQSLSRE